MKLQASDALSLYILAILVFFGAGMAGDPGLGWHLRAGQRIVEGGLINFVMAPGEEPFSFVEGLGPWVHDQWLSDVLFWGIISLGGFPLLHASAIGIVIAAFILITAGIAERSRYPVWAIGACYLLPAAAGSIQWLLRPVIFSFLFFAVTYRILYRLADGEKAKSYRFLPLLFIVWANLHPAFVLGLFLLGVFVSEQWIRKASERRNYAVSLFGCLFATLLTPYGVRLHESILYLGGNAYFMSLNREWLPPNIATPAFLPFYTTVGLLLVLGFYRAGYRKLSFFEAIVCLALLVAGYLQRRYIPFFAIAATLPLLKLWQNASLTLPLPKPRALKGVVLRFVRPSSGKGRAGLAFGCAWILLLFYTAVRGHLPTRSAADSGIPPRYPELSVGLIESLGVNRVFHSPDWGGYMIWRRYPERSAFIDDRNTLHGESRYREYFALEQGEADWDEAAKTYDLDAALLREGVPLIGILDKHPDWERRQIAEQSADPNAQAVVFLRKAKVK